MWGGGMLNVRTSFSSFFFKKFNKVKAATHKFISIEYL